MDRHEAKPDSLDLASAILDGVSIDWARAEASVSERERDLLNELRFLAAVADHHRQLPPIPESPALTPAAVAPDAAMRWGRLRLIDQLGAGTFGTVYRAWDPRLQREVALKLLPVSAEATEERAASVIHEAASLRVCATRVS